MSLFQLGAGAARGALGRTFLIEKRPDGIPKVIIIFDVVNSEVPEFTSDVTMVPVEQGKEVTDHIQLRNPTLKLDGSISESPLDLEVQALNLAAGGIEAATSSQSRSNFLNAGAGQLGGIAGASLLGNSSQNIASGATDAIIRQSLFGAYSRRARMTVVTQRQQYENMVIQKMSFPKNSGTGRKLDFSITFQEIRVVKPFTVNIEQVGDSVVSSATTEVDKGSQVTNGVSAAQDKAVNSSILNNLFFGG